MTDAVPELALGPTDATAEHIAAHVGMGSILGGDVGADYNPKSSPFFSISKESPENAPIKAFTEVAKMKKATLSNIAQGSASIFGKDSPLSFESANGAGLHDLHGTMTALSESPDVLVNHLVNQTAPISDHMPGVATGLSQIAGSSLGILHGVKPDISPKSPLDSERTPSQVEVSKFNRIANLLDKPLSIFSKIKDGSVTEADMGVVQSAYPNLVNSMKEETMKNLVSHQADKATPLPLQTKLGLSKLFGQDLDSSLSTLLNNQMVFSGMKAAKSAVQAQQASPSGMNKMKMGTRDETKAQQSAGRAR